MQAPIWSASVDRLRSTPSQMYSRPLHSGVYDGGKFRDVKVIVGEEEKEHVTGMVMALGMIMTPSSLTGVLAARLYAIPSRTAGGSIFAIQQMYRPRGEDLYQGAEMLTHRTLVKPARRLSVSKA